MDPITIILTALAAGATTGALDGLKDEVKEQVKAAWGKLRGMVSKRLHDAGDERGEAVLTEYQEDPKTWEGGLKKKLTAAEADKDEALLAAAKAVLALVDQQGTRSGKYHVTVTGSEGVQVGDGNTQTNTFTRP
jgi:hypothetical protein